MFKLAQKITARFLILLLFSVQLLAELAHQHAAPNLRPPAENLTRQIQTELPRLRLVPPLCLACLFSSAQHSLPPALTSIVSFAPIAAAAPIPLYLFSQFYQISSRNRAPPAAARA